MIVELYKSIVDKKEGKFNSLDNTAALTQILDVLDLNAAITNTNKDLPSDEDTIDWINLIPMKNDRE